MTLGFACTSNTTQGRKVATLSRRVSAASLPLQDDSGHVLQHEQLGKRQRLSNCISRQVSQDGFLPCFEDNEDYDDALSKKKLSRSDCSPSHIRCVSEFDKLYADMSETSQNDLGYAEPFPIPLRSPELLKRHIFSLRLEADLHPMRLILSRLMAHPTLNRKGIFNTPVDPVKLNLPDYFKIIKKPMDLGTIKIKLHGIEYQSRQHVAQDIRLVFSNAMTYNPSFNTVHEAAKQLTAFFEEQVQAFVPELAAAQGAHHPSSSVESRTEEPSARQLPFSQSPPPDPIATAANTQLRRKKRGSKVDSAHACDSCNGHICSICHQGCLPLEPALLVCNGANCAGSRIRKGAVYFILEDGSRQFCQRCHTGLPPVLPPTGFDTTIRYKRDLLKRKNDEEVVERWIKCSKCEDAVHQVCAMHDQYLHSQQNYLCPGCEISVPSLPDMNHNIRAVSTTELNEEEEFFTFVSGSNLPISMTELEGGTTTASQPYQPLFSAERLSVTELSSFIQEKVRQRITSPKYPNAEKTINVRVIADCDRFFHVPEVVRKHFRMQTSTPDLDNINDTTQAPPVKVNYRSRAIALFQKVDGIDVCIFCMYVHEYDGDNDNEEVDSASLCHRQTTQNKRVYIAYLDSVEHFRPRSCRTVVYREIIVSYLAAARKNGYDTAHIWACPPSRGNSFIFWNHPASQRTPNQQRLVAWYHGALSHAIQCGVVTDVQSLYESGFEYQLGEMDDDPDHISENVVGRVVCPPLLDGDFWIEEAVRIHGVNTARYMRIPKCSNETATVTDGSIFSLSLPDVVNDPCPALQVASLLRDRIIAHPSSLPFRRPVNAAAMKLLDYHKIITQPMDLGTIYSRCMLGEYQILRDLVADVELVVANAQKYNPKGHIVHVKASEIRDLFFMELNELVTHWQMEPSCETKMNNPTTCEAFLDQSLSLDESFETILSEVDGTANVQVDNLPTVPVDISMSSCVTVCSGSADSSSVATSSKVEAPPADLINGGPDAVEKLMVGKDTWLLEKTPIALKAASNNKKQINKKRKGVASDSLEETTTPSKRRRQSWLGCEVAASVRKMRTYFFTCSLAPKNDMSAEEVEKQKSFEEYVKDFKETACDGVGDRQVHVSKVADARHGLLEFSQFRNLEFDTLRHAKYSTTILLYHLHNADAPGTIPHCTSCNQTIRDVRWHKINKVVLQKQQRSRGSIGKLPVKPVQSYFVPEELCLPCYEQHPQRDIFIPLPVSMPFTPSV